MYIDWLRNEARSFLVICGSLYIYVPLLKFIHCNPRFVHSRFRIFVRGSWSDLSFSGVEATAELLYNINSLKNSPTRWRSFSDLAPRFCVIWRWLAVDKCWQFLQGELWTKADKRFWKEASEEMDKRRIQQIQLTDKRYYWRGISTLLRRMCFCSKMKETLFIVSSASAPRFWAWPPSIMDLRSLKVSGSLLIKIY